MDVLGIVGGAAILVGGLILLADAGGLGRSFVADAGRTVAFSWQRTVNRTTLSFATRPSRIGFGVIASIIGAVWLQAGIHGLLRR